ncbi:hypothetical protein [Deinococcus marmoris]|uniref:hypothetical protein n=1 Tax=Deinococcus marmoris TaxID=249408 RepID=UPI00096A7C20|nr:hypothetical protein [Deinococcus marmoris]
MDKIIDKIAALGIPGLILLVMISISGFAGAAAITSSLAILGGPFGMLGGIAVLGIIGLISRSITKYGFENLLMATAMRLIEKGHTREEVIEAINRLLISRDLKNRIIKIIEDAFRKLTNGDKDAEPQST